MTTDTSDTETLNANPTPLVLAELEIPGRTGPLPSGEWGINLAAAQDNFPQNGLQLYINPWTPMGPGDSVQVLLGGVTGGGGVVVASDVIDPDEVGKRVTLFVPSARLTDGPTTIGYRVTRLGSSPETSDELRVYVKLDRPGGNDENGSVPGHSELHMVIPPEIVQGGVDKGMAKDGVPITIEPYPNIAENDVIRLSWGGQLVIHTVTKEQATAPASNPIEITVEEDVILAAGDSGPEGLAVVFEVYDVVQNRSEDWSAEIRIVVDTGSSRADAPIIKEAINSVLDLDTLGDAPVTVQIIAMGTNFVVGDEVVVNLKGTAVEGGPVDITLAPVPITSVPSILEIRVPNADIRLLAQSQAVFSYRNIKANGSADILSKGSFISIIGEIKRLLAPIARDARQGALDPLLPRTVIEIPWDAAMAEGQVIMLKWLGTQPDFSIYFPDLPPHPITHGDEEAKASILMTVDGAHLTAINGGTLELFYQLLSDQTVRAIVVRESLHADLLNIGAPRAELPVPEVAGEVDGVLNPEDVPLGTLLTVPRYNGQASGDDVHYEWLGSKTGLHTDSLKLNDITATRPVPFDIASPLIQGNLGGTVQASYFVVRVGGGGTSVSNVLELTIGESTELTITSVKDSKGTEIANGTTTYDTSVTLTGTAAAGQQVQVFDGSTSLGTVTATGGTWTLTLNSLTAKAYTITAKALYGSNPVSAARTFTVAVATAPTISSVKDAKGTEIANGTTTYDTSVTLTGTAVAGQQVEILDGTATKGTVTATGGTWTLTLNSLTAKAYSITAKALYGSNPVSAARTFTVAVATAPTISSVKDAKGTEIANGTTTYDTSVTLTGTAVAGQQVEILDGASLLTTVTATGVNWTYILSATVKAYNIKARGLYGSNPESAVRSFTVEAGLSITGSYIGDIEIPYGGHSPIQITLTGTSRGIAKLAFFVNGSPAFSVGSIVAKEWRYDINLHTEGSKTIEVQEVDVPDPQSATWLVIVDHS